MKIIKAFLMSRYLLPLAIGFSIVLMVTIAYSIITESYENDSMPDLLSGKVQMSKLKKYPATSYLSSENCLADARVQVYLQKQNYPSSEMKLMTCDSFPISPQQKLYFVKGVPLSIKQSFFLAEGNQQLEEIVQVKAEYPANRISDVRGDGSAVFFTFEGWNNPKKVVELRAKI